MKKSLIALAFGTLGLGIAEFTMMGILPYVAADLNIGIPVAGHFISAYALGVCAGAPMLILARKRPLKHILLALMALMLVGNLGAAMAYHLSPDSLSWQKVHMCSTQMLLLIQAQQVCPY
jgi:DHA1 family arabinose polymer transporter-like MFS transporter